LIETPKSCEGPARPQSMGGVSCGPAPAMPCGPVTPKKHRQKLNTASYRLPLAVARKVKRQEIEREPEARKAVDKEYNKLSDMVHPDTRNWSLGHRFRTRKGGCSVGGQQEWHLCILRHDCRTLFPEGFRVITWRSWASLQRKTCAVRRSSDGQPVRSRPVPGTGKFSAFNDGFQGNRRLEPN
jgi:hypothetical protein